MLKNATPDDIVDWAIFIKRHETAYYETLRHICDQVEVTPEDDAVLLSMAQAYVDIHNCEGDSSFLTLTYHHKYAHAIRDILGYSISGEEAVQAFVDATGLDFESSNDYDDESDESLDDAYIAFPDQADGISEEEIFIEKTRNRISAENNWNRWVGEELKKIDTGPIDTLQFAIEHYDSVHAKMINNITLHVGQEYNISLRTLKHTIDEMIESLTFLIDTIKVDKDITDTTVVVEKILEDSDLQLSESLVMISATYTPERLDVLKRRIIIEALLNTDNSEPHISPFGLTLDEAKNLLKKHILTNVFAAKNDS